jgi:WD40 repeat protein
LRWSAFARREDGRARAAMSSPGTPIQIMDLERDVVRQNVGVHEMGNGIYALSADGRWAATCGWHSDRVRLWNVQTGKMVHEWVFEVHLHCYFTPDSRALVISRGEEYSFWDVETLQPILRLRRDIPLFPGLVAFSPDGKLMALEMAPAVIHLKDVATGRTVARLEDPHGDRNGWMAFTPDGTQLVTAAVYAKALHVWDLRAIRARLKTMDLDWDWPEFKPAPPAERPLPPLNIWVITQEQEKQQMQLLEELRRLRGEAEKILRLKKP